MSINSDLTNLNVSLKGQDQELPDRGLSTGFLGTSHGVDFEVDATNALGGISGDTGSDARGGNGSAMGYGLGDPNINFTGDPTNDGSVGFSGTIGRLSGATSDAPGEENSNCNDNESGDAPYA